MVLPGLPEIGRFNVPFGETAARKPSSRANQTLTIRRWLVKGRAFRRETAVFRFYKFKNSGRSRGGLTKDRHGQHAASP